MIINLICGNNIFTSNDKQWGKIRGIISCASHEFILDYRNNMLNHEMKDDNENTNVGLDESNDFNEYNYYQKTLYEKSVNKEIIFETINNILKDISLTNYCINPAKHFESNEEAFLKLYKKYLHLLTILGLSGIFSLLNNTSNNNGFYSIGNSYDIANAIDLIMPFINNEYIEFLIFEVLMIFNHSVKNNLIISITNEKNASIIENENKNIISPLIKNIHKKGSLKHKLCKKKHKYKIYQNFG
jgi:hypothetical protein